MADKLTYKDSGVDKEAGYESVKLMRKHVKQTYTKGVLTDIGGFSGLFSLAEFKHFDEPVLVSGTDGVGTKLKIAFMADKHNTIGEDAVAMCVNDILCQGAKPLFFLDYIATDKVVPEKIAAIVEGVSNGCIKAGAALIGGETAEMPGLYQKDEYDIAGFAVGVVDKKKIINGSKITVGDVLIGLPSSGVHSNGYSLVRKVFFDNNHYRIDHYFPELQKTIGEALLTPTRIYVNPVYQIIQQFDIKGICHITGGGFYENIPRMFSSEFDARIRLQNIPRLPIFGVIKSLGEIDEKEMYGTFNMGMGMVMAVSQIDADTVLAAFHALGEKAFIAGEIIAGEGKVLIDGM